MSDSIGQTPSTTLASGKPFTIVMTEASQGDNQTLGQTCVLAPERLGQRSEHLTIHCFQPILSEVRITPGTEAYPAPFHDRWVFTASEAGQSFELRLHVGMLLSEREVRAYFAYHGVVVPNVVPALGVVVRSAETTLPQEGLWVTMDCSGLRLTPTSALSASWMLVGRSAEAVSTGKLVVSMKGFDGRLAQVFLEGRLGSGDNVICLYQASRDVDPIRSVSTAQRSDAAAGASRRPAECCPEPPGAPPNWTPKDYSAEEWFGPERAKGASLRDEATATSTTRVGGVVCRSKGETWSGKLSTVYDGSTAVPVRNDDGAMSDPGGHLQLFAEFDTVKYGFDTGAKCKAAFRHEADFVQTWEVARDRLVPGPSGGFTIRPNGTLRRIQTISMELMGTSITECDAGGR